MMMMSMLNFAVLILFVSLKICEGVNVEGLSQRIEDAVGATRGINIVDGIEDAVGAPPTSAIDTRPYLSADLTNSMSSSDMIWSWNATAYDPLSPTKWFQAAYVGDGRTGAMVTAIVDTVNNTNGLRVNLGRTDLWACTNRMPIGFLTIQPAGVAKLVWVDMRLNLFTATLFVNFTLIDGSEPIVVSFQMYINADETGPNVLVLFVETLTGGPNPLIISWTDDNIGACGSMQVETGSVSGQVWGSLLYYSTQKTPDGTFTTAYTQYNEDCGQTFLLSVESSQRDPVNNTQSLVLALKSVADAVSLTVEGLAAIHQAWWSSYWSESFFAFDSAGRPGVSSLESFTLIASYRYASAARYTLSDLMGPWGPAYATTCIGPWCQLCWDMNEQVMMYFPTLANRGKLLASPAFDMIPSNYNNSWGRIYGSNSPGRGVNMLWFLAQLHRYIVYYGDETRLINDLYPALRIELTNSGLKNESDGFLHIEGCVSPEYPMGSSKDCNYHLSILKWAAETAKAIALDINPTDPLLPTFSDIASRIAPFPIDPATGSWAVAAGVPFAVPHRHYSHLLMMFDLGLTRFEDNFTIMKTSLDNWFNITCAGPQSYGPDYHGDDECRGFTQAAMSAMSSILHRPDAALGNLTSYLTLVGLPNAMYGEEVYAGHPDEFSPVSESAYSAAASTIGLLLSSEKYPPGPQSGSSTAASNITTLIRLLPSSPFVNTSFFRLRCENSILVSIVQTNGVIQWVAVEADLFSDQTGEGSSVSFILQQSLQWASINSLTVLATNGTVVASPFSSLSGAFTVSGLVRGSSAIFIPEGIQPLTSFGVGDIIGRNISEANFWGSRFIFQGEFP